jgi:hypothetical protein
MEIPAGVAQLPDPGNATVERVIADDTAFPAESDQFITRHHPSLRAGKRHENLHDARLKGFRLPVDLDLPCRRPDDDLPEPKVRFGRQIDPLTVKIGRHRQTIGNRPAQGCVSSGFFPAPWFRDP